MAKRVLFITARDGGVSRVSYDPATGNSNESISRKFGELTDRTDIQAMIMLIQSLEQCDEVGVESVQVYCVDSLAIKAFTHKKINNKMKEQEALPEIERGVLDYSSMFFEDYTEIENETLQAFLDLLDEKGNSLKIRKISELRKEAIDKSNEYEVRMSELAGNCWSNIPMPQVKRVQSEAI